MPPKPMWAYRIAELEIEVEQLKADIAQLRRELHKDADAKRPLKRAAPTERRPRARL